LRDAEAPHATTLKRRVTPPSATRHLPLEERVDLRLVFHPPAGVGEAGTL
jgi:hypothetical protein